MNKYIFDTSIYINSLHSEFFASRIEKRFRKLTPFIYFSSVVVQELLAGAIDQVGIEKVKNYFEPFEKVGRIITPSYNIWKETGFVIAKILNKSPQYKSKLRGLINDTLIALSSYYFGATVVTCDKADFSLIKKYKNFELEIV